MEDLFNFTLRKLNVVWSHVPMRDFYRNEWGSASIAVSRFSLIGSLDCLHDKGSARFVDIKGSF